MLTCHRILKQLIILVVLLVPVQCLAGWDIIDFQEVVGGVCEYESQDFTTYTTTDNDPVGTLSATSSTITFADISNDYLSTTLKDFTADYFDGDFTVRQVININTLTDGSSVVGLQSMGNTTNGTFANRSDAGDEGYYVRYFDVGGSGNLRVSLIEGAVTIAGGNIDIIYATDYYITVARDDSGGANGTGQITLYVRTGSHTGTLVGSDSVDSSAGQQLDFRYLYMFDSYNSSNGQSATGTVDDAEVKLCL